MTEEEYVKSLSNSMWPTYNRIEWRKRVKPQSIAIVIDMQTEKRYLSPFVELPSQRLIFPESGDVLYRVITTMDVDDAQYFCDIDELGVSIKAFDEFAHSNVISYAMATMAAFNSLSKHAHTMETWRVQEASATLERQCFELAYFVAASLNENGLAIESIVYETTMFVHSLSSLLGLPTFAAVSQQHVYEGCLSFISDLRSGDAPEMLLDDEESTTLSDLDKDFWADALKDMSDEIL